MAAAVLNVNRDPKQHPQPIKALDFFPEAESPSSERRHQSATEVGNVFRSLYAATQFEKQKK